MTGKSMAPAIKNGSAESGFYCAVFDPRRGLSDGRSASDGRNGKEKRQKSIVYSQQSIGDSQFDLGDAMFASGTVGMYVSGAHILIDDVVITGDDVPDGGSPPVVVNVEARGKLTATWAGMKSN